MTSCSSGSTRYWDHLRDRWAWDYWCDLGGMECQALMMLDISEDGTVELSGSSEYVVQGGVPDSSETRRTCDGVLLRGHSTVAYSDVSHAEVDVGLTLAL